MGVETLDAVADRGYYAGEEIRACEEAGITVTLPKPMTSNSKAAGRFSKQAFRYAGAHGLIGCPSVKGLHTPSRPGRNNWSCVATGPTPVRVALSRVAAPPARNDSSPDGSTKPCLRLCRHVSIIIQKNDNASSDRKTSVRHYQVLDGSNALSYETASESSNRDGAQCARLQHEARDGDHRRWANSGSETFHSITSRARSDGGTVLPSRFGRPQLCCQFQDTINAGAF